MNITQRISGWYKSVETNRQTAPVQSLCGSGADGGWRVNEAAVRTMMSLN